jgi:uncharacterized protein (DUF2252 family)
LQQSIQDFNEFLKLPAKSNRYVAIWDAAWAIVAATVPALRLMPALAKVEKAAAIEMATAKAFMKTPKLVARITTATAKRHNVADVIAKVNNIRDKVSKATGIHTSVPVDQSKTPVKEMIKEADDARKGRPGESVLCRTKDCAGSGRLLHWREPAPKLTSVGLPL